VYTEDYSLCRENGATANATYEALYSEMGDPIGQRSGPYEQPQRAWSPSPYAESGGEYFPYFAPPPSPDMTYVDPNDGELCSPSMRGPDDNSDTSYVDIHPDYSSSKVFQTAHSLAATSAPICPVLRAEREISEFVPSSTSGIKPSAVYTAVLRRNSMMQDTSPLPLVVPMESEDVDGYLDLNGDVYIAAADLEMITRRSSVNSTASDEYVLIGDNSSDGLYIRVDGQSQCEYFGFSKNYKQG